MVAAATTVRGEIHLKSGKLNVQSKEFEIEKGTISFVGNDPSNPEVTVTAGWTAPDGTKVLADYVGPVKTGKVNLRSEPPRPKNEIVQLILFGTADGSESTPYASKSPSTGTQAGTAVGGLATDGLSKGIDQLTGMNVTKIDTSDSSNPKADVEFQVAKDISLQLAYVIVQPPPGDNPDLVYATIDWRFVRNWSLETTFGDAGSTFADMVWQYRY
jgi:translocation and assembly module TamB